MTTLEPLRDALKEKAQQRQLLQTSVSTGQRAIHELDREIAALQSALNAGRFIELAVTDHALLRYAERVLGFDRDEVVNLIRDRVGPLAAALGNGKFPVCPGFHAVVKDRTVVTIEPAK